MDKLDNLIRHLSLVREASIRIGKELIEQGRESLAISVVRRGHAHDLSKFFGCEWDYLHNNKKVKKSFLELAIKQHVSTNDHHPEFFEKGMDDMDESQIIEWVCDVYARSVEFGTNLKEWIDDVAVKRFNIKNDKYELIMKYVKYIVSGGF